MAHAQLPFDQRLSRIVRTHARMQNGVTHRMRDDGLIVAQPRVYNPRFPLKGLLLLLMVAFLFKGYLMTALGPAVYETKVAELAQGTMVEKAGAWVMQSDPATEFVAARLAEIGL